MKTNWIFFLFLLLPTFLFAQDLTITFSAIADSVAIDSVRATNVTSDESISLPGWEPLTLLRSSGINDFKFDPDIQVYPNPFNGETTIKTDLDYFQIVHFSVKNLVGQVVIQSSFSAEAGQSLFKLSLKSPGIYLISLTSNGKTQSLKAICINSIKSENSIQLQSSAVLMTDLRSKQHNLASDPIDNQYSLSFEPGDLIHYQCYSGRNRTIIADYPEISKNFLVEFHVCIDLDEISYPITRIGSQVWTTRNLAYLPRLSSISYELYADPSYYVYDYTGYSVSYAKNSYNYKNYGVLYNWAAAKAACPDGWHLPTVEEWSLLFNHLDPFAGYKIREKSGEHWAETNSKSSDEVAFSALPGGELYPFIATNYNMNIDPGFLNIRNKATFWTNSLEERTYRDGKSPIYIYLDKSSQGYNTNFEHDFYQTHYWYPSQSTATSGYSVRCVLGKKPSKPVPELIGASDITDKSFIISARILDDGGSEISQMGFCWADHEGISVDDKVHSQDYQEGIFSFTIRGLNSNSTYYVNVYAINDEGIAYGEEIAVTTSSGLATVLTSFNVQITDTSALAGGTLVTSGGNNVSQLGFCWATHPEPTRDDHLISSSEIESAFRASISNLSPRSTYYLRAFAVNSSGTSYGAELKLKTAEGSFEYQGDIYGYVTIGDQVWMNQNLRYLPDVAPPDDESDDTPKYYVYNYLKSNTDEAKLSLNYLKYGVLYNWHAAMQSEPASDLAPSRVMGICPPGWHLPSKEEYNQLEDFAGDNASDYKSDFDWYDYPGNGANLNGFNALPAGQKSYQFLYKNYSTDFWTTTYGDEYHPCVFGIGEYSGISSNGFYRSNAYSVRCIQTIGNAPPRAFLSVNRVIGTAETEIIFDASDSYDYDTPAEELLCRWDWDNDGIWDTEYEPKLQVSHLFPERGVFVIVMEIKDGNGLTDQAEQTVTIGDARFTDSRDQNEYVYVTIGDQNWMAENLRYLPEVHGYHDNSEADPRYYVIAYSGDNPDEAKQSAFYSQYGVWYNFPAAMSACPEGWHLPSDEEWKELERALGMSLGQSNSIGWRDGGTVGHKLKATYSWLLDRNGSNSSLFSALGAQLDLVYNPDLYEPGYSCNFWTHTSSTSGEIYQRQMNYNSEGVYRETWTKQAPASVRCVQDD